MELKKTFVICLLIGVSLATEDQHSGDQSSSAASNVKRDAPLETSGGYGPPAETSGSSGGSEPSKYKSHSPTSYSKSIPAAAIRNVETVAVTKTITPVVTKTTTYNTHSEPALSIGHVQGYSQSATGQPKVAPVQFQTHYTSYQNPTVGVNGPVTYTGPAVVFGGSGGSYALPLSAVSLSSGGGGSALFAVAPSSGGWGAAPAPAPSSGWSAPPPTSGWGAPSASYSMNVPQVVSFQPQQSQQNLISIQQLQQLQQAYKNQIAAMASQLRQISVRAPAQNAQASIPAQHLAAPSSAQSSPYALYQAQASLRQPVYQHPQQQHHHHQLQQFRQPIAQPTRQIVQTYAMPSVSYTSWQPVNAVKHFGRQRQ